MKKLIITFLVLIPLSVSELNIYNSLNSKELEVYDKKKGEEDSKNNSDISNVLMLYKKLEKLKEKDNINSVPQQISIIEEILFLIRKNNGASNSKVADVMHMLAILYQRVGQFYKSEKYFKDSLTIKIKADGNYNNSVGIIHNNLGLLYQDFGFYNKALISFENALIVLQKNINPDAATASSVISNMANIYKDLGLYMKSIYYHLSAGAIREKRLGKHQDTAMSFNELAELYETLGLYSESEKYYNNALDIQQEILSEYHIEKAKTFNGLGSLYSSQDLLNKSENNYLKAKNILEKNNIKDIRLSALYNNLGFIYTQQSRYIEAEKAYLNSLKIKRSLLEDNHILISKTLSNLSYLSERQKDYSKAQEFLSNSLKIELINILRETPYLPLTDRTKYLSNIGESHLIPFSWIKHNKSAAELALFSRLNRHGLLQEIERKQSRLISLGGKDRDIIFQLRQIIRKLSSKTITTEQREELNSQREKLEVKIYRKLPEIEPRIVSINQIAKSLPAKSILIEFQRFKDMNPNENLVSEKYMALILNHKGDIKAIDLGSANTIDKKIQRALFETEQTSNKSSWDGISNLLLTPLKNEISGASKIFFSPDSEINRIPFAALKSPIGDNLLGEEFEYHLLTTGRELINIANNSSLNRQQRVVVAYPDFNFKINKLKAEETSRMYASLPWTKKEGVEIAELLDAKLLIAEKATSSAILELNTPPQILHIATHSYFEPLSGDSNENILNKSGIVLAGANFPKNNIKDDGFLTALEVASLDWEGTELVVISGCDSGRGELRIGEGVYGLKRSIAVAGAKSSLLSLWEVKDRSTSVFMKLFYQRLRAGESKVGALAATQKDFRDGNVRSPNPDVDWSRPFYWAAFQLSGDGEEIQWLSD